MFLLLNIFNHSLYVYADKKITAVHEHSSVGGASRCFLTYSWTCPLEDVTVHTVSLQEVLIAVARDPHQRTRACQRAHVDVQCPHVVTYHITIHWKVDEN